MGTVRMLAGSEIRRHWRSTLALALLVCVIGGLIMAAAAGARRSSTALDRFNASSRSSALEISIGPAPSGARLAEFRNAPGVAAFARLHGYALGIDAYPELAMAAPVDNAMGQCGRPGRASSPGGRRTRARPTRSRSAKRSPPANT